MSDDFMNGVDPIDIVEEDDEEGNLVVPKNIVDLDEEDNLEDEEGYAMFSSDEMIDEGGLQFE